MPENEKYKFTKLTPKTDVNLGIYENALNFVFKHDDIHNVAITGPYCSGKSSVLNTYESRHKDKKFIHISISHFNTEKKESSNDDKQNTIDESKSKNDNSYINKESVLERKIINQLIQQIPAKNIDQSFIKRKEPIHFKTIFLQTIAIVFLGFIFLLFKYYDNISTYIDKLQNPNIKISLEFLTSPFMIICYLFIAIFFSSITVFNLIFWLRKNISFKSFNFHGAELKIADDNYDSYFDKYLNDIIYIFRNSDADVIVFEDLDRFELENIFDRLHEINRLINVYDEEKHTECFIKKYFKKNNSNNIDNSDDTKNSKKIIRFFYLVRDDIFVSKDRTKFVDYIVPIVPVMDSSNSYDQFVTEFDLENNTQYRFDNIFLQDLSLYIDDMRILKNIQNEFLIYYNQVKQIEPDCNKLLAMITYKNIFPKDFSDLHMSQGYVYSLFDHKNIFINDEIEKINNEIEDIENKINDIKNSPWQTLSDVMPVFAYKYLKDYPEWRHLENEKLDNFLSSYLYGDNLQKYLDVKTDLQNGKESRIQQLNDEISLKNAKIRKLSDANLTEIINSNYDSNRTIFYNDNIEFENIKNNHYFDLLKYLIRNGYIDETYSDYMNYFYGKRISLNDKQFVLSVKNKHAKHFSYKLENPDTVLQFLRDLDFNEKEVLNFDLLSYLLKSNSDKNEKILQITINQLKNTKNFEFINAFYDLGELTSAYIKALNSNWHELFYTALTEKIFTDNRMMQYSVDSIIYSFDILGDINKDNCITDYLSNNPDLFFDTTKALSGGLIGQINKISDGIQNLNVKFISLNSTKSNENLIKKIYQYSLYKINRENLIFLEEKFLKVSKIDALKKNYTLLLNHPDSAITKYINQNINIYLGVLSEFKENINDDENAAIALLNTESDIELKKSYINKLQTKIQDINQIIFKDIWPNLLLRRVIVVSEKNILKYFDAIKIDQNLIDLMSDCINDLNFSKEVEFKDLRRTLFYELYKLDDLPSSITYKNLLETNIMDMDNDSLVFMRNNCTTALYYFIKKYISEYVEVVKNNTLFKMEELLIVLDMEEVKDSYKIRLINLTTEAISVKDKKYSDEVMLHILQKKFMQSDLEYLYAHYGERNGDIDNEIFNRFIKENNKYDYNSYIKGLNLDTVSWDFKEKIIGAEEIDTEGRLYVLLQIINNDHISKTKLPKILGKFGMNHYSRFNNNMRTIDIDGSDENYEILNAMKENNYIYDFEEDLENNVFKVIKKTPLNAQPV